MSEHIDHAACICTCYHRAPSARILRSPAFNQDLASYWKSYELGVPALYDQILTKLYDHHEGQLLGFDGQVIDLHAVDQNGDDWIDRAFGSDVYRTIHRYLARTDGGFQSRLSTHLMNAVLLMYFARQIATCDCRVKPCQQMAAE